MAAGRAVAGQLRADGNTSMVATGLLRRGSLPRGDSRNRATGRQRTAIQALPGRLRLIIAPARDRRTTGRPRRATAARLRITGRRRITRHLPITARLLTQRRALRVSPRRDHTRLRGRASRLRTRTRLHALRAGADIRASRVVGTPDPQGAIRAEAAGTRVAAVADTAGNLSSAPRAGQRVHVGFDKCASCSFGL